MAIIVSAPVKQKERKQRSKVSVPATKASIRNLSTHRREKTGKRRKQRLKAVHEKQIFPTLDNQSVMERIADLPSKDREALLKGLTEEQLLAINFDWKLWRRPDQTPPPADLWDVLLIESGRGFGKTRIGAEQVKEWVNEHEVKRIGLGGRTATDIREVMVEGDSGVLSVFPPWQRPIYEPSKLRITFRNGALARLFSDEAFEKARGPQNEKFWWDEMAAMSNIKAFFDNVMFGLRIGKCPQVMITTTPRRKKEYREIFHSKKSKYASLRVARMHGSSYSNLSNLASMYIQNVIKPYEGTRLGKQELWGEFLADSIGALWTTHLLEEYRVDDICLSDMVEIAVGVDPQGTYGEDSADTGIVVVGKDKHGHGYTLADWTVNAPPNTKTIAGQKVLGWADIAAKAYFFFEADAVVGETNFGGDMVEACLRNATDAYGHPEAINYVSVRASRGKRTRAEPIAMISEKGLIHHLACTDLDALEEQMTNWEPGDESPNNLDAMVWAYHYLFMQPGGGFEIFADPDNWKFMEKMKREAA